MILAEIMCVYAGSDGEATKAIYAQLDAMGPMGHVATNLFRAHKASARAKVYRGGLRGRGSFKRMAYERKQWALDNLDVCLREKAHDLVWGWKRDRKEPVHCWVLYVELPTGQVSFHTEYRGHGPDFAGEWDGVVDQGSTRVCQWIALLFAAGATADMLA